MVTMIINFNERKLNEVGTTVELLLQPFEEHCRKHQIARLKVNIFEKDGKHALALIGIIMCQISENDTYLELMDSWYWDVDGKREDLLKGALKWKEKR